MYLPIKPAQTCAQLWLKAMNVMLLQHGHEAFNVLLDVDQPTTHTDEDIALITKVDAFLRDRDANPISTVINTIFPTDLARRHKGNELFDEYLKVFNKLTPRCQGWGRYFERMSFRKTVNGDIYPLRDLIEKMSKQHSNPSTFHHIYELSIPIYDPEEDSNYTRGGQCLSHLSFKLHPERGVMLSVMYRNHHYMSKLLGNLMGLGELQQFIAEQVGTTVGPLTVLSTHAEVDTTKHWGITDVRSLLKSVEHSEGGA